MSTVFFDREKARLIHKGKLLKKDDVWPGTTVQLFGSEKKVTTTGTCSSSSILLVDHAFQNSFVQLDGNTVQESRFQSTIAAAIPSIRSLLSFYLLFFQEFILSTRSAKS